MLQDLILTLHIIVCCLLVILILLQSGKEGMGVIFGGGNTSVFGSTGAGGILAKLTTLMAIIFVITSLSYTYVTSSHTESESQILNIQIEDPVPPKAPEATAPVPPASPQSVAPTAPAAPDKADVQGAPSPSVAPAAEEPKEGAPQGTKTEEPRPAQ